MLAIRKARPAIGGVFQAEENHSLPLPGGRRPQIAAAERKTIRVAKANFFRLWNRLAFGNDKDRFFLEDADDVFEIAPAEIDKQKPSQERNRQDDSQNQPDAQPEPHHGAYLQDANSKPRAGSRRFRMVQFVCFAVRFPALIVISTDNQGD